MAWLSRRKPRRSASSAPGRRGAASSLEINPAGRALLPHLPAAEGAQPALADFFSDPAEFEQLFQTLLTDGEIKNHILHVETSDASRPLHLPLGAPGAR